MSNLMLVLFKAGSFHTLPHLQTSPLPTSGSSGGPIIRLDTGTVVGLISGRRMDNRVEGERGWGAAAEGMFEVRSACRSEADVARERALIGRCLHRCSGYQVLYRLANARLHPSSNCGSHTSLLAWSFSQCRSSVLSDDGNRFGRAPHGQIQRVLKSESGNQLFLLLREIRRNIRRYAQEYSPERDRCR